MISQPVLHAPIHNAYLSVNVIRTQCTAYMRMLHGGKLWVGIEVGVCRGHEHYMARKYKANALWTRNGGIQ